MLSIINMQTGVVWSIILPQASDSGCNDSSEYLAAIYQNKGQ